MIEVFFEYPPAFRHRQRLHRWTGRLEEMLSPGGNVAVKIGEDDEARHLNRTYRGKDASTDVLSFPFSETRPDGTTYLGDIFISGARAKVQAREAGISLEEEILRLIIHGLLHLMGHEHSDESSDMLKQQEKLFHAILSP